VKNMSTDRVCSQDYFYKRFTCASFVTVLFYVKSDRLAFTHFLYGSCNMNSKKFNAVWPHTVDILHEAS
jgi:hypothetical protein